MSIAASALVLAAALATAASAYKCKQSDGSIAFQQTPCAATAEQLGHQSYERQPDAPHQQYVPSRDGAEAQMRAEAEAGAEARAVAGSRGVLAPVPTIPAPVVAEGYSCSDGSKTWIQQAPCPPTVKTNRFVPVSRAVGPRGERANGSAVVQQETPVQQRPMTREDICRQVRSGADTQQKEQRASDSSYERNKLRSQYGC